MPEFPADRNQPFLLPPSFDEWVPEDHLVRFVDRFVDHLAREEWARSTLGLAASERGAWRYPPLAQFKLWIYGFMIGVRSTRGLERLARESLPARWLTVNLTPDHNTLWRFYDQHRSLFARLFHETVRVAYEARLVDLSLVAVDGTRIKANAAGDQMLTPQRLEQVTLAIDARIAEVEAQGEADDGAPGPLPADWRQLIEKQRRLELARERIAAGSKKANLTDPDAQQMTAKGINTPRYNAQVAVAGLRTEAEPADDPEDRDEPGDAAGPTQPGGRLIVGNSIRTRADDRGCLAEMIDQVTERTGEPPAITLADVGYYSGAELDACARRHATIAMPEQFDARYDHPYGLRHFPYDPVTDTMTCPEGVTLKRWGTPVCRLCPAKARCSPTSKRGRVVYRSPYPEAVEAHRAWMARPEIKALYRHRSGLVEGVFGTLRSRHRVDQWLHRGRDGIEAEWHLLTGSFNLHTLWRAAIGHYGASVQTRLTGWFTTAAMPPASAV